MILVSVACVPDTNSYSAFETFAGSQWLYGDTVVLTPDTLPDSGSPVRGTLLLVVRHNASYDYSNIWLEVTTFTTDTVLTTDTVEMELADAYGRWLGKGIGTEFCTTDTFSTAFDMRPGISVGLRHIMRTDTLADIEQAGIMFRPAGQ